MKEPVGIVLDDRFALHDTGPGHPERPARLAAVRAGLELGGHLSAAQLITPVAIDAELLASVHDAEYLERVSRYCQSARPYIDTPDSAICGQSEEIARLAAGGVVEAARRVARGALRSAFCAVRPPGHHAERDRSMGFCLYANAVLAARALQQAGCARVAVLDWDVHHGNGTQHILEDDPQVLFISLHGHPDTLYPGTGYALERGRGAGEGYTLNIPFMPGAQDEEYRAAFKASVTPAIVAFAPDAIVISCGFDAHQDDPLADIRLTDEAFRWMMAQTMKLADQHCAGRIVSLLEGGYNLDVLRRCANEHVNMLRNGA